MTGLPSGGASFPAAQQFLARLFDPGDLFELRALGIGPFPVKDTPDRVYKVSVAGHVTTASRGTFDNLADAVAHAITGWPEYRDKNAEYGRWTTPPDVVAFSPIRAWRTDSVMVVGQDGTPEEVELSLPDAGRPTGVYFTCNPLDPGRFEDRDTFGQYFRANEKRPKPSGIPQASDEDVPARRWVVIDIDPHRPVDVPATDGEKRAATDLFGEVERWLAARGWPAPLLLDSGNGVHGYWRLAAGDELPGGRVFDRHTDPLWRFLTGMAAEFKGRPADIDAKVFNAARIFRLPGFDNRKGPESADRPHRPCRVLSDLAGPDVRLSRATFDATLAELAGHLPAVPSVVKGRKGKAVAGGWPTQAPTAEAIKSAERYAASPKFPPSIERQNGSAKLMSVARHVCWGFGCGEVEGARILMEKFNPRCEPQWAEWEVKRACMNVMRDPGYKPFGWHQSDGTNGLPEIDESMFPDGDITALNPGQPTKQVHPTPPAGDNRVSPSPPSDQPEDQPAPDEASDDPHKLARGVLARYRTGGRRGIVYWRDEFHTYGLGGYTTQPPKAFAAEVNAAVRRTLVAERQAIYTAAQKDNKSPELPPLVKTTRTLVSNVTGAMEGMCRLSPLVEAPSWINAAEGPDPREVVSVANGLVHLPAYAAGRPDGIRPHSPDFFAPPGTGFPVSRDAPRPELWEKTLREIWPDCPLSPLTLQEWFGYVLCGDTSQEKMLMLVGQSGGGKGTILKVLTAMLGERNIANPNLHDFGSQYGLSALVGKAVAVVADAQSNGLGPAAGIVVQNLLKISGRDWVQVERKYLPEIQVRLGCRLVFAANEVIRLPNTAGAFNRRWSVLTFTQDFSSRKDDTLADRLCQPESLAGIFNWAVEGWVRLKAQGRFTQPADEAAVKADLVESGSPVAEFVAERCVTDANHHVGCEALYADWKAWCKDNGDQKPGSSKSFGIRLRAYLPKLKRDKVSEVTGRKWHYHGIALRVVVEPLDLDELLAHEKRPSTHLFDRSGSTGIEDLTLDHPS